MPNENERVTRKLRAILSADVKGYSLLMADDEVHTIQTLKAYRKIIADLISLYSGRVVDSPGDNILAEFRSSVDAVECAVKIQKKLDNENSKYTDDKKVQFRIGVNVGDVIQDGDRIYGNGVNVAARIEGLADPGGVCISRNAYDHIKGKLKFGYEYLGDQEVKNITEPVRVYKVLTDPQDAGKLIGDKPKAAAKNWIWVTIVVAAVVITSSSWMIYHKITEPDFVPASVDKMAFPLPDKPSIAVLAFDNQSGDSEQEYFSDGITDEIITALSKTSKLFVISRTSSFKYKGKEVDVRTVGRELGVQYVLEGSVRKSDSNVRITAQLINAKTNNHIWAERYDREIKDSFVLQDEITMKILTALEVNLSEGEQALMMAKGTRNLDAYIKVLQSTFFRRRMNVEDNLKARRLAEEAIALDPYYAIAYTTLGRTHIVDAWLRSTKSIKESTGMAIDLAEKALNLDESLADAYDIIGNSLMLRKDYQGGIAKLERALKLEPNGADLHGRLGMLLVFVDKPQEAIQSLQKAIRLNPTPPSWYLHMLAASYYFIDKYDDAIYWAEKAVQQNPKNLIGHVVLCSIYSSAGRMEEARKEASEILKINPDYSVLHAEKTNPLKNEADKKRYFDALRKAGLPE